MPSILCRSGLAFAVAALSTMPVIVSVPPVAAAASPARSASHDAARATAPAEATADGPYCSECTPPLVYLGGPVMDTTGPDGLTITPIFWAPDDATPFPDGYQQIISDYIANVAADSGTTGNVYAINTEYYAEDSAGVQTNIVYRITAGEPIVDTSPFPADDCPVADGYTGCITDGSIRAELSRLLSERGLPTGLDAFYPVFFPPGIVTQDSDGSTSADVFCGYHSIFGDGTDAIVYGNEPYEESGCDGGQAPNGLLAADGAIGTLSHEINEAITDPADERAWNDSSGNEIGDICNQDYGPPLGSTDPDNPDTTAYNQVINGVGYYTQTEFSNQAFATLGVGKGCVPSADAAGTPAENDPSAVGSLFTAADQNTLEADGTSTTAISTFVSTAAYDSVPDDVVNYSIHAVDGSGECGAIDPESSTTDADGLATTTYTASGDDVVCAVVATDTKGGQSATVTLYQGSQQVNAPSAADTFPTSLQPGAEPAVFTTSFTNATKDPIKNAQVDFWIYPADGATANITAEQVTLSYSTDGPDGEFTAVDLTGSTVDEGGIEGLIGDDVGTTIDAGATLEITYRIALDASAPTDDGAPLVSLDAYLDQVNPASLSGTNLADTLAADVFVSTTPVDDTAVADAASTDTATADTASADNASADAATADTATADTATADTSPSTSVAPADDSSGGSSVVIVVIVVVAVIVVIGVALIIRKRAR